MESKGDQLAGNLDTEHKRQLFDKPTDAYGKAAAGNGTELGLGCKSIDYDAAVVLFSEWKAKLPSLITG